MLTVKEPVLKKQQLQPLSQPKPPVPQRLLKDASSHEDEIWPVAKRKWEEAGRPAGDGVQFWLAAEEEILRGRRS
jgi:hypothetical protein